LLRQLFKLIFGNLYISLCLHAPLVNARQCGLESTGVRNVEKISTFPTIFDQPLLEARAPVLFLLKWQMKSFN
jgi:hypothetical protein